MKKLIKKVRKMKKRHGDCKNIFRCSACPLKTSSTFGCLDVHRWLKLAERVERVVDYCKSKPDNCFDCDLSPKCKVLTARFWEYEKIIIPKLRFLSTDQKLEIIQTIMEDER